MLRHVTRGVQVRETPHYFLANSPLSKTPPPPLNSQQFSGSLYLQIKIIIFIKNSRSIYARNSVSDIYPISHILKLVHNQRNNRNNSKALEAKTNER